MNTELEKNEKDEMDDIGDYFGTPLLQRDADVLMALYPQVGEIPRSSFGRFRFSYRDAHVTKLIIRGKEITSLPATIGNLSLLTELVLRENKLTALPDSIGKLTSLTELNVSRNQLISLPDSFINLNSLTKLILRGNRLTTLPSSFGNLTSLTKLDIGTNRLTIFPTSIGKLTSLTKLDVIANELTTLPSSFGNLTSLTELNVRENHLISLPDSFGNLHSLTELHLGDNQLTMIPTSFGNLISLTKLYLWGNLLETLPASFGNLNSLTELHLGGNQLTKLPPSLGNLNSLTELHLGGNQLTKLPPSLGNLNSLTELDISENQLTTLPTTFHNLKSLEILELRDNRFTSLSSFPTHLPKLTTLDCSYNQLTTVTDFPTNLPSLKVILLEGNALTSMHGLPPVVQISEDYFGDSSFDGQINVANNYLENLAGLPTIRIGTQNSPSEEQQRLSQGYYPDNIYLLHGNTLRSFHGIPRSELFTFTYDSKIPQDDAARSMYHTSLDKEPTKYEEEQVLCSGSSFYLSYTGAALLEKCVKENYTFREQHPDLNDFDFPRKVFPKDAPESWLRAHDALFEYYRLSPLELAYIYLAHLTSEPGENAMTLTAIERLKYEGSVAERKLLESDLPVPHEDPVLRAIQARFSLDFPDGHTLLL
jgi:Leucine-rich repeat (LRR) protein